MVDRREVAKRKDRIPKWKIDKLYTIFFMIVSLTIGKHFQRNVFLIGQLVKTVQMYF